MFSPWGCVCTDLHRALHAKEVGQKRGEPRHQAALDHEAQLKLGQADDIVAAAPLPAGKRGEVTASDQMCADEY